MRVALARKLGGIDALNIEEIPKPHLGPGQVLIDVRSAGVGPWDVGFLGGGFPGIELPFVPGQEIAGIVAAAADGAGLEAGDRVFASLFPAGGGLAERAAASADRVAVLPTGLSFTEAASLVVAAGTAHEGLVDHGQLQAGQTVLITAAAGGVGSAAIQIAVACGARPLGVASPANHEYLAGLGATDVFDYHADGWVDDVRQLVPDGVDLLFDCAGGPTRDAAIGAVRDRGRVVSIVLGGPAPTPERGITIDSFAAHVDRPRLEALRALVEAGTLRPQIEAVFPLEQATTALTRVAAGHTRGKIVVEVSGRD